MPWEEVGTEIRHRIKDPADFQEGSFRRITLKASKPRVFAVVGKLKNETAMTIQALRFPTADGWTVAKAKIWVRDHYQKSEKEFEEAQAMSECERKEYRFDVKTVSTEEGTFEGVLSVYDVVDLGNDLIEKGAFTRTLASSGGKIPVFWRHAEPIGSAEVKDEGTHLSIKGRLVLEVQRAREALALMKAAVVRGLSIGYNSIPDKTELIKGVRHLRELKLLEASIVPFPMLPLAQVTDVKEFEAKDDFATEFDRARTYAARWMMMQAVMTSLDSIIWDSDILSEDKLTASSESIDQFKVAYLEGLPAYLELRKASDPPEIKEGRVISAVSRAKIQGCIDVLQALLEPPKGTSTELAEDGVAVRLSKEVSNSEMRREENLIEDFVFNIRELLK